MMSKLIFILAACWPIILAVILAVIAFNVGCPSGGIAVTVALGVVANVLWVLFSITQIHIT